MRADDADRASWLHRELRRLPYPRAPHSLLPRVLALVARPWYAREWLSWPLHWQAASLALAAATVAGGWLLAATSPAVADLMATVDSAAAAARVLWRLLVQPVFAYVLALSIAACITCAAGWAALSRFALPYSNGVPR
jgi:hypothetical protein